MIIIELWEVSNNFIYFLYFVSLICRAFKSSPLCDLKGDSASLLTKSYLYFYLRIIYFVIKNKR